MSQAPEPKPLRTDAPNVPAATAARVEIDPAHQKRIIDAFYRVSNLMAHVTDLKQLLNLILIDSKKVVGAEASSLLMYDEVKDDLYFEVALGEKGSQVKVMRVQMGVGIAGTCAQERRTLVVNDVAQDKRHAKKFDKKTKFVTRNILATPLVRNERLIGVLEVLNKFNEEPFTGEDARIIEFFGDQVAIAIENALLVEANLKSERLAALGQAVASISHYVKNILTGVRGSSSLIDHALEIDNMALLREAWPVLKRSNDKITSLVQDMLTYSKEREPERIRANLNRLAEDVYETMAKTAAERGVVFEVNLAEDMCDSMFDADRLHDAVLNIVSNAIDATQEQTLARVIITTQFAVEANRIMIAVEDNGPGVPEAVQDKIFEPFFSTKGSKGTGLGLAVTRKVVREHGGDLLLDSQEGKGTRFTIWLPHMEPQDEPATDAEAL